MHPLFAFRMFPRPGKNNADDFFEDTAGLERKVHALEAEISALQKLVCHLLVKNERMRMRLRACENIPGPWDSVHCEDEPDGSSVLR